MVHTVIFDVGGTLIGSPDLFAELGKLFPDTKHDPSWLVQKIQTTLFSFYRAPENERLPFGAYQNQFLSIEAIIRKTLAVVSQDLNCPDQSSAAKEIYYHVYLNQSYLYEDTLWTLNELKKRNIKMVIASDADAGLLSLEFQKYQLQSYFDHMCVSSEIKAYKPSDQFVAALKPRIAEPYSEILFVGDSEADIITGNKLGVKTVLKSAFPQPQIKSDYSIVRLSELIDLL